MKIRNITPSKRIQSIKPYFYVSRNQNIKELSATGIEIIRLDIGAPDLPPSRDITEVLITNVNKDNTHSYTPIGGSDEFRKAISAYYKKRFDVEVDPQIESLGLIGSKEGLFNIGQSLLDKGDVSLVPDPGYPVYAATSVIAGADIVHVPLNEQNKYHAVFDHIPNEKLKNAKIVWLNYPNNPTGASADITYYEYVVDFFKNTNAIIINDAAYSEVSYGDTAVPSILEVDGAKEFCVEINSLSKSFNMAGWRLGMAVGCEKVLNILNTYKSQIDSSTFSPILSAGCKALDYDSEWILQRNEIYRTRRDLIYNSLIRMGFQTKLPTAGMYIWAKHSGLFSNSLKFSDKILNDIGVSITPGVIFGQQGESHLRFSFGLANNKIIEAMRRLEAWIETNS